ncbi:MAG TPA: hypothetical protein PLT05_02475 [bacterium]|nr:hypothetical protein [bacterium]
MKRGISYIFMVMFFASCGAGGGNDYSGGGSVGIKIVDHEPSEVELVDYLPNEYVVTITGDGIEGGITAKFDGDASEGSIDEVPTGDDRTVAVEAVNARGIKIKSGVAHGVVVGDGQTDVEVEMKYHPIFVNLADGGTVENTRFMMKLLADPSSFVRVVAQRIDDQNAGEFSVSDEPTADDLFQADKVSWRFAVSPPVMEPGRYRFSAIDDISGLDSSVEIRIVDGRGLMPAPLVGLTASTPNVSASIIPFDGNSRMEVFR